MCISFIIKDTTNSFFYSCIPSKKLNNYQLITTNQTHNEFWKHICKYSLLSPLIVVAVFMLVAPGMSWCRLFQFAPPTHAEVVQARLFQNKEIIENW